MKCEHCGKEMTVNLKFGISEFICECGYQTDEMAILNEELQYLRKIKEDYIDSDKALETAKLTAKFASDLMMASYFDFMSKQQKTEKKPDISVKIENNLYSERQTNTAHLRQITELQKDFDKKLQELKKQHIQEIKEAVKKARERQKYADFPDELINNIMNIMITEEITEPVIKLKEIQDVIDGFYLSDWEVK